MDSLPVLTKTNEYRLAKLLLEKAGSDYLNFPEMRGEIESWLQGDNAPASFDLCCEILGLQDLEPVRRFVRTYREGKAANGRRATSRKYANAVAKVAA